MKKPGEMSGREKAAMLMIALGPEASAQVFKHLREDEIEQLTLEIASVRSLSPGSRENVVEEFYQMCMAQNYISQGGIEYAREILEKALGTQRALEFLHRLTSTLQVRPFDFIRRTDPAHLINFIQNEHPQTIALIMAYLNPDQASVVLSSLTPERQADVARRIAIMDRTSPEIIREIEKVLERKLSSLVMEDYAKAGGLESVVEVLNRVDRGTERTIMETLEVQDPELAEQIKRRMFLFEDIVYLDDRSVQRVLREVDLSRDLPMALKAASEDLKSKIFKNMSKRAVETLKENIEYLGPVRLRDVEEVQQKIVNLIRKLEEEGEVIIARSGGDEIVV
ncbi:MAG: flagellar motor switch protein FliG [Acetobacteraceae bacterium]|nr:flagellar motor switch protein FliG [Acetobacteraceae bacterium]